MAMGSLRKESLDDKKTLRRRLAELVKGVGIIASPRCMVSFSGFYSLAGLACLLFNFDTKRGTWTATGNRDGWAFCGEVDVPPDEVLSWYGISVEQFRAWQYLCDAGRTADDVAYAIEVYDESSDLRNARVQQQ
jgi:hypothetical protein